MPVSVPIARSDMLSASSMALRPSAVRSHVSLEYNTANDALNTSRTADSDATNMFISVTYSFVCVVCEVSAERLRK